MRQLARWMWILGVPTVFAGCALEETDPLTSKTGKTGKISQDLKITAGTKINVEAVLDFNTTVFAENPTTLLEQGDFHGYEFDARAGAVVTVTMNADNCARLDTFLTLFGPEDANGNRAFIENDDAFLSPCVLDSRLANVRLGTTGTYLIVAHSFEQQGGGHYRLRLSCNNGLSACVPSDALTFQRTRIQQTAIDAGQFSPEDLFEMGDFLFEVAYRVEDGMGNALPGLPGGGKPRPNFREIPNNVHFQAFGGPEAQSCVTCHQEGGDDGAGDTNHNIFQAGDGINRNTGLARNPPPLLGMGLREAAAKEMSAELAVIVDNAKRQAAQTNTNVTVELRPPTNNINFGTAIARPDGTVDLTGIRGIDTDLQVKPFGWKGREQTIRRFIEGGWRVHFGMQTEPSVNNHCRTPNVNTFGTGANCQDPDDDGLQKEINDGQMSATSVYLAMLEMPIRIPAPNAAAQTRVNQGEALFNQVNCQACHRQFVTIKTPRLQFKGDTTTGAGITIDFARDMREPRPALNSDGSMSIEVWSNFRRQDMGPTLADSKNFNQIRAQDFVTPPLWGIRDTAPYLHDSRSENLFESVVEHGEADDLNSVNAFKALTADEQQKIIEFMSSLGRVEDLGATQDLSRFNLVQFNTTIEFFIPSGTVVRRGGYLVIGRNATKTQFQTFYGRTLPNNVVYINAAATGQSFPSINGNERYSLFDSQFVLVDGTTIPQPSTGGRNFGRLNCGRAAGLTGSWSSNTASVANSNPGSPGPGSSLDPSGAAKPCISEVADVQAGQSSNFEFIEIFVP
jgi:mono/diheme cytochrome c family protein